MVSGPFLALDTSAAHCAAAFVGADGRILARKLEQMSKGQAERLLPLVGEVLAEAGAVWADLRALAVGVGPGNFTGVRISVAATRGIALARNLPAIGVSSFEMMLSPVSPEAEGKVLVALAAPRGQLYVQRFVAGVTEGAPQLIAPEDAHVLGLGADWTVRGTNAEALAAPFAARAEPDDLDDLLSRLVARARWRLAQSEPQGRPAPLYVRPADAAPPSDPPPVILDL